MGNTKKKNSKKKTKFKLNTTWLIISIIIIFIAFLINRPSVIRPLLWLIAIIFIIYNINKNQKIKISHNIIIFIISFIFSILLDGIIVITFQRIPLFSYNIINVENTKIYNAVGVRVWQCDKDDYNNLIVDLFYNKGYMCDAEDITAIDSNSFLNSIIENYDEYYNNYVKITGKISKKNGQNSIEMQAYETSDITVNGYVTFASNITLKIIFNESTEELDNYDIYDEITVVGIIKNLDGDTGSYVVYMYDSKIVSSANLNNYSISIAEETSCSEDSIIYSSDQYNLYTHCLAEVIVSYSDDNKYELSTVLSSNKLTLDELLKNASNIITNENDSSLIYQYDNYNILVCDSTYSNNIYIGPTNMEFSDITCSNIDNS